MHQVLLLSSNLFFASRIKAAAEQAGLKMRMGKSIEKVTLNPEIAWVIVDLGSTGSTPEAIVEITRQSLPTAQVLGFAGHVQTERLAAARASGFDAVWTHSQLDRQLSELFESSS